MLGRKFLVKISHNPFSSTTGIYFGYEASDGFYVAKLVKLEYEKIDDNAIDTEPTLTIPRVLLESLQAALDDEGIKPESTASLEGLLKATKYHLEDMRKLVFKDEKNISKENNCNNSRREIDARNPVE